MRLVKMSISKHKVNTKKMTINEYMYCLKWKRNKANCKHASDRTTLTKREAWWRLVLFDEFGKARPDGVTFATNLGRL